MNRLITSTAIPARELKIEALASISASFERLCLAAGLEALGEMMEADAQTACGPRHGRGKDRTAHRWGKTKGKIGLQHGAFVEQIRIIIRSYRVNRIEACEGFVKTPKSFKQGTTICQRFAMNGAPAQCILVSYKSIGHTSKALQDDTHIE